MPCHCLQSELCSRWRACGCRSMGSCARSTSATSIPPLTTRTRALGVSRFLLYARGAARGLTTRSSAPHPQQALSSGRRGELQAPRPAPPAKGKEARRRRHVAKPSAIGRRSSRPCSSHRPVLCCAVQGAQPQELSRFYLDAHADKEKAERAWEDTTKIVEKYSDELVDQWNQEIDGLLTFVSISHCYMY